jgi:hypothetical protein
MCLSFILLEERITRNVTINIFLHLMRGWSQFTYLLTLGLMITGSQFVGHYLGSQGHEETL